MSAEEHLNDAQFSPHGPTWYQRPLPGMERLGANKRLPVEHIFKHADIDRHPAEYNAVTLHNPTTKRVKTDALRPTQKHVDEDYLYKGDNPTRMEHDKTPGAIQDGSGRYRLVDGHHRAARALLEGQSHIDVRVWDTRKLPL